MKKVDMPVRDAKRRVQDFEEVALGYTKEEALMEASRCLNCQNPRCVKGCPVGIEIPKFIEQLKLGNIDEALEIIHASSSLPAVCGRVCPQEKQCEAMCIKGFKGDAIAIGSLERYVADHGKINKKEKKVFDKGKTVGIVGSGPSGLSCAGEMIKKGYSVTVYEALHKVGGVLSYGIPSFRLPRLIVEREVENLKEMGVQFITDAVIGNSYTLEDLKKKHDAIYLATGAGLPKFMGIENENANEVFSANEILTRINLMEANKEEMGTPIIHGEKAVVVGGGNVAIDAARSLRRLGFTVSIVYRRGMEELPARKEEVIHAIEEGVLIKVMRNPISILVDEEMHVKGVKVAVMQYTDISKDGRMGVVATENNETIICDVVVMALGTNANTLALKGAKVEKEEHGLIVVDSTKTSEKGIFAGGDVVSGAATVILAMEAGKRAANEIMDYFNSL